MKKRKTVFPFWPQHTNIIKSYYICLSNRPGVLPASSKQASMVFWIAEDTIRMHLYGSYIPYVQLCVSAPTCHCGPCSLHDLLSLYESLSSARPQLTVVHPLQTSLWPYQIFQFPTTALPHLDHVAWPIRRPTDQAASLCAGKFLPLANCTLMTVAHPLQTPLLPSHTLKFPKTSSTQIIWPSPCRGQQIRQPHNVRGNFNRQIPLCSLRMQEVHPVCKKANTIGFLDICVLRPKGKTALRLSFFRKQEVIYLPRQREKVKDH